jgi:hypothetical protein
MEWLTILIYAAGAILALVALKVFFEASITAWAMLGAAATTAAVALQIAPGLYSGDRALAMLSMADASVDAKAIDAYRERVRRDIVARAVMFPKYPAALARVQNFVRG